MNIKVCHITSMHEWDDDRIYQRACLGLAREGLEVHLIAQRPTHTPSQRQVKFHWLQGRSGRARRWYSSKGAIKIAINVKADVYHFHDPDLLPHIIKLKKALPNSRIIYDIHENYAGRFKNWGLPSFLGKLFRYYEKHIISKIDGFTVVSVSMKRLFDGVKKPSAIIRNSVDVHRLSNININEKENNKLNTIYTSGTNSHARNCLQTVKSLEYIETLEAFQMIFAGSYQGGIETELLDNAKKINKEHLLKLEGMLPWEENFKRTAQATLGCVFYEDNPNNRVGIPNRIFEYMYCGLAVVATDFPELRDIVDETECGILVNSEDPKAIANAFNSLLNNPKKVQEMGRKGKMAIENNYGYHIDLKNTIQFYNDLLKCSNEKN